MKQTNKRLLAFTLLIVTAALYRIVPGRPYGFEPMIAMAIFGGFIIADKKWAFAIPLAAMLLSDALYEGLTRAHLVNMPGFYNGQWMNYLLLAGISCFGIFMKRITVVNVVVASIAAPLIYFVLSNTGTWAFHGGYQRPVTLAGWMQAMADGLPFLKWSLSSAMVFTALFFGTWAVVNKPRATSVQEMVA